VGEWWQKDPGKRSIPPEKIKGDNVIRLIPLYSRNFN
jgi:hypothetical protein